MRDVQGLEQHGSCRSRHPLDRYLLQRSQAARAPGARVRARCDSPRAPSVRLAFEAATQKRAPRGDELAAGQAPFAIILGRSRVPAEIVVDQGLGDLGERPTSYFPVKK